MSSNPVWQCSKCGKKFKRNNWHSCRTYEIDPLFARFDPKVRSLYKKFEAMVLASGPVNIEPKRTGIAFLVRVRAIGCSPRKDHLRIVFAFDRQRKHRRFVKVHSYSGRFHAHWIEVHKGSELDTQVRSWIREACAFSAA